MAALIDLFQKRCYLMWPFATRGSLPPVRMGITKMVGNIAWIVLNSCKCYYTIEYPKMQEDFFKKQPLWYDFPHLILLLSVLAFRLFLCACISSIILMLLQQSCTISRSQKRSLWTCQPRQKLPLSDQYLYYARNSSKLPACNGEDIPPYAS